MKTDETKILFAFFENRARKLGRFQLRNLLNIINKSKVSCGKCWRKYSVSLCWRQQGDLSINPI